MTVALEDARSATLLHRWGMSSTDPIECERAKVAQGQNKGSQPSKSCCSSP